MFPNFPLFPDRASEMAARVDALFFFALGVAALFSALIACLILYLGVKYRRRAPGDVGLPALPGSKATMALEITWSIIPLLILTVMFVWGTRVFFAMSRPPSNAMELTVVGRQWMWKVQHPQGRREINALHVPIGRPIKLTMTSQDVIHSFFMPAFRTKADVLPGRYTTLWVQADTLGTSYLFCAEYCGTEHSKMVGRVTVMEPHDYEAWLAGEGQGTTVVAAGDQLFETKACNTCHRPDTDARAPMLAGLFGRSVPLEGGRTAIADESYIRESILNPQARVVAGYQPIMPTFKGQLSEEEILSLIAYIKALGSPDGSPLVARTGRPVEAEPAGRVGRVGRVGRGARRSGS